MCFGQANLQIKKEQHPMAEHKKTAFDKEGSFSILL